MLRAVYTWGVGMVLAGLMAGCSTTASGLQSPLAAFEQSQVFHPVQWPDGDWSKQNQPIEDAWFVAADGTRLHGWYFPHEDPVAVVLFAHGNAGHVGDQVETLRLLHDRHRLSIMTFDYRGYGRSEGTPSESGILQDARAARRWLALRESIEESDIVLFGQSLGGGVMVDLAAKDGARGLVLGNTFTSLPDVATAHAPLLPARFLMRNRLDSLSKIGNYHGPLFQVHGSGDRLIPWDQARRLFSAANEPKRFESNSGDHNSPLTEANHEALAEFLQSLSAESSTTVADDA
ncbi:MAG: alpha/beta hydrolase [Planctomycetales bacterium]